MRRIPAGENALAPSPYTVSVGKIATPPSRMACTICWSAAAGIFPRLILRLCPVARVDVDILAGEVACPVEAPRAALMDVYCNRHFFGPKRFPRFLGGNIRR